MSDDHRDLIFADLEDAVQAKWDRGRQRHGEEWSGARGIVCLADEILDAIVYGTLEYVHGDDNNKEAMHEIVHKLIDLRRGVETILRSIPEEEWEVWGLSPRPSPVVVDISSHIGYSSSRGEDS
jgi:hypothetical protein